jgi:hypothetical protein
VFKSFDSTSQNHIRVFYDTGCSALTCFHVDNDGDESESKCHKIMDRNNEGLDTNTLGLGVVKKNFQTYLDRLRNQIR